MKATPLVIPAEFVEAHTGTVPDFYVHVATCECHGGFLSRPCEDARAHSVLNYIAGLQEGQRREQMRPVFALRDFAAAKLAEGDAVFAAHIEECLKYLQMNLCAVTARVGDADGE